VALLPRASCAPVRAAGWHHTCGVLTNGSITCWGRDDEGKYPGDGKWADVAAGASHSCPVSVAGEVMSWGADTAAQSSPPQL
jgi:alpha-tubulin suppressor-like RCC1 family protein